jgi:Cu+-exporting ATPase
MHQPHYDPRRPPQKVSLVVTGMHCTNCSLSLEKHLLKVGANSPSVNYATGHTTFLISTPNILPDIVRSISRLGYSVTQVATTGPSHSINPHHADHDDHSHHTSTSLYFKSILSALLTVPMLIAMFLPHDIAPALHEPWIQGLLATPVFIIGVLHFGASGIRSLRAGVANMDVLICLGILAGYISSVITLLKGLSSETIFFEATSSIVTFVMIGHLLEDRAVKKTTSAIESLAALQPRRAHRLIQAENSERFEEIETSQIAIGDLLRVNSGDTVPTDGVVVSGFISCNEAMISGEPLPIDKNVDDRVIGGSIASDGSAIIRATAVGDDTILASIVKLVLDAQQRKPQIQRLGDAVSAVFVPGVIVISIAVLSSGLLFFDLTPSQALVRALAIAVVACPCAMGLATPTAIMVALGQAARAGILIRGGDTIERLSKVKEIAFDKTGTLTSGDLKITDFETHNDFDPELARSILASLQRNSSHPIAKAIVREFHGSTSYKERFTSFTETRGIGLTATTDSGATFACGGAAVIRKFGFSIKKDLVLIKDQTLIASLNLGDFLRAEASDVINRLKKLNLKCSIISGDTSQKTETVAQQLKIVESFAERTPEEKLKIVREKQINNPIAYIGDGINDAPTLAEAAVGVSISSASDVALNSAQIILTQGSLSSLPAAINLSRVTVRTIKQNLFWAFAYNIVTIPLAALGYLSPLAGALIMTGSDIVIVANSLRIKFTKL